MKIFSKLLPASKMKLVISVIGVLALVVFSGVTLFEATKAEVVVTENGKEQTVKTHANTVEELLAELGINFSKHDKLSHDMDAQIDDEMNITYKEANKITVTIDGKEQTYHTTMDTVGEFLKENNMTLSKHDEVSHDKSDAVSEGLELSIDKAFQITINDGGKNKKVWTNGGTVDQVLEESKISYDKSDKIKANTDGKVTENTTIKVVRVEKETVEVEEKIDYKTEKREDKNLEKGKKRVIEEGNEGLLVKKFEVTKENGKEVNRKLISEKVKQESENRVVAFGTKEEKELVTVSSSSNDSDKSGGKVFSMRVTAYSADCAGCSGYTATGINLNANPNKKVVSVDPSVIPLGSTVWVEGYGTAIAGDTGGGVNGNHVDVHLPTRADALAFGTRYNVKVKVLD
ncbi:ubiquitin-like domain-containing protein [Virgibacillus sp. JSM 102003]|uniref:ubiquitin-like domain-containing protein n=1 Tax=Virgibacillus sp. JSM 102003 TaxID=1562108 RepID=UPI0035BF0CFD